MELLNINGQYFMKYKDFDKIYESILCISFIMMEATGLLIFHTINLSNEQIGLGRLEIWDTLLIKSIMLLYLLHGLNT